jgi:penicillin amidase
MRRLAGRLVLWTSGILLLTIAGIGSLLLATLPRLDGDVSLAGPQAPIEIARDGTGVVTIRAAGELDVAFALGFVHAQDRLFQMDFMRRLGAGRLSEVVGPAALKIDRFMRRLGLYRVAQANYEHLPPEAQRLFQTYAAGVNAYIAHSEGLLPPEFLLLGYRPEAWQPADSLVWGRLMAWQLSGNWRDERLRQDLADRLQPRDLDWIWPTTQRLSSLEDAAWMPAPGASNNWALSGSRSTTGKPLLANDPHLGLDLPAPWYLARIEMPGRILAGATAPGVPLVVIGHNGHVAWGFATSQADTQDLFIESLVDDGHYRAATGVQALLKREETIHIRGEASVVETVEETSHGPLIDIDPKTHRAYALAWTGLRPDDRTALGLLEMNRSTDAAGFREALRDFESPVQDIIYADVSGNIGFMMAGRIPIRKAMLDGSQMPVTGASGAYDWAGTIPFDDLPQTLNPSQNFLATANNRVVDDAYRYFVTARWEANYRIDRIRQMIAARPTLDLDGMAAMQMDDLSLAAKQLAPLLLSKVPEPTLAGWDDRMDRDRPQPLIFEAWLRQFAHLLLDGRLGGDLSAFWFWDAPLLSEALRGGPASALCDDPGTPAIEDCVLRAKQAHDLAFRALAKAYGPDPSAWRWAQAHRAHFDHPLFSRLPVISALLDVDLPVDGDNFTVNRATPLVDEASGAAFDDLHGASLRALFDLADLSRSRFIIAGGQSGNPMSAHYADFTRPWRDGRYVTIVGRQDSLLRLIPEPPP